MKLRLFLLLVIAIALHVVAEAQVYQWSAPVKGLNSSETGAEPIAFLWIPENCTQVKALMFGQHNLSEEDLFGRKKFREGLTKLGIGIVWVSPAFDMTFDFNKGAGDHVKQIMNDLAKVSGYTELSWVPIIPIGHSACATFPWNFAAWNPKRTLAVISLHGDAPQTPLTGNGSPTLDWGKRHIDGVPGLMIQGEYEWWNARVQPALDYRNKHPKAPISFLCDAGHGHFDVSEDLVDYLLLFIEKAAQKRLPKKWTGNQIPALCSVIPEKGWLKERWRKDTVPAHKAAKFNKYKGNKTDAFWYFDKEIAKATEEYYKRGRNKKTRYLGIVQDGELLNFNKKSHARITPRFSPEADGLTFRLRAVYTDSLHQKIKSENASEKPKLSKMCGPVLQLNDTTFRVQFFRMGMHNRKRTGDIWLLASSLANKKYKSTVQQLYLRLPYRISEGKEQKILFDSIPEQKEGVKYIELEAKSTANLPVSFYVKEGPAVVQGDRLIFTQIPPRSKFPMKITVVAWQYGIQGAVQTAAPIERTFQIINR